MNSIHEQPPDRYVLVPVAVPETSAEARMIEKAAMSSGAPGASVYRGNRLVGEIVDWCVWPHEHRVQVASGDGVQKAAATLPAGTAYAGLRLTASAWKELRAGKLSLRDLRFEPRSGSVANGKLSKGTYQGGPTGGNDFDGQAQRPGSPYGNVDPEASSRYGPGTSSGSGKVGDGSLVASALARGRAAIQRYAMHVQSPHARLAAGIAARQQIIEFGAGPDGQPVATDRYNPAVLTAPNDLNPQVYKECMSKIGAMTKLFKESVGRYPVAGQPLSQDDVEYWSAVDSLLDQYYGSGPGFSGPATGGYNRVQ